MEVERRRRSVVGVVVGRRVMVVGMRRRVRRGARVERIAARRHVLQIMIAASINWCLRNRPV